ncbi:MULTISPECIES: type II toxin-antitoxin system RelE/ParE family toxin [unclassified Anabaena]|uniref:type II toxin-antitoxin system RelE/ParE family toxin n=1 Tax=unclassified Anabaena TaxID=2619674 RepID=UPI0014478278|nr:MULTISPECIES: type II toxin-antitoxin system RelE/ParE family toxin [unclassified Anabaena]MTJ09529.1 type II toxin-antitoxin system RelE/ParE family toxin [Anabaena sp. UHCC 0204]MTJ56038.1 type II toxin-antitoxin system RelE/ParE family toxin [Anabaena sp. UHCC 0253]
MNQCLISPQAIRDLDSISEYFLNRNIEAGEILFQDFTKKCENLLQFPNMGRSYEYIRQGMRGLPLNGYIIFYQLVDNNVEILRVVSDHQDLEALFAE